MSKKSPFVVSADWVEKQLGAPEFRVVDASWYLPAQGRNAAAEYAAGHIPGAVFYDHDFIADPAASLPHTIPSPDFFAIEMSKLGLSTSDTIVVYDGPGFFSAPRAWWMLRIMGARNVYVLEGGIDGWKREGRRLETDLPEPAPSQFIPAYQGERVVFLDEMKEIVAGATIQLADARPAGRFTAAEPEPRAGVRGGHMPGARNVPASALSANGVFHDLATLTRILNDAGIDLDRPVVTTCGSGVTAAVITLALESLGHHQNRLFDGSWTEWGSQGDTPVETGLAR